MAEVTSVYVPQGDFVTTTLNGAITNSSTSFTIGSGLTLDANGGFLQIHYDSVLPLGTDDGPETIAYTGYNTGTGAITGVTRAQSGTTAVAHSNGANVQCAPSAKYFLNGSALGYAQVTSTQNLTGSQADVTSLSVTVTVPAGGVRRVRVSWQISLINNTNADNLVRTLVQEDGSQMNSSNAPISITGVDITVCGSATKVTTAGSHTYKLQAYKGSGTGTLVTACSSPSPGWILVELV